MRKLLSIVVLLAFSCFAGICTTCFVPHTGEKVSGGKGSFTIGTASPISGNGGYADELAKNYSLN